MIIVARLESRPELSRTDFESGDGLRARCVRSPSFWTMGPSASVTALNKPDAMARPLPVL